MVSTDISGPKNTGEPLADLLVNEFTKQLETMTKTDFDVEQYWNKIGFWRNLVADLYCKATALVLLQLQLWDTAPALKKAWERERADICQQHIDALNKAFNKDIPDRPGFKVLQQIVKDTTDDKCLPLYSLLLDNGKWLHIEDHWIPQGEHGYYVYRLAEDYNNTSQPASRSFALAYNEVGWSMMASRLVARWLPC